MQFSIGDARESQLRTVVKIRWNESRVESQGIMKGRKSSAAAGYALPLRAIRYIDGIIACAKDIESILSAWDARGHWRSHPLDAKRQRLHRWALAAGENTHVIGQCCTFAQAQWPTACAPSRTLHARAPSADDARIPPRVLYQAGRDAKVPEHPSCRSQNDGAGAERP